MCFQILEETNSGIECFLIVGQTDILRQTIDSKSDSVGLLLGVKRGTIGIERPIDTTLFAIHKPLHEVVIGSCCQYAVRSIIQHTRCRSECP